MNTVLVIEHRHELRDNIAEILNLSGFAVMVCVKPKTGFEKAKNNAPDVIVFDIMIEEEEVIEFFGRLISEQKTRKIPVVVLDGNIVSPSIRQQIAELNAVHVNKPFSQEELIDAIKSAIDHRKK